MRLTKYLAAAVAASLAVAPAMAAPANQAASLSLGKSVRVGASSKHKNGLLGGGIIVAIVAAAAVGAGIYIGVAENNETPSSS